MPLPLPWISVLSLFTPSRAAEVFCRLAVDATPSWGYVQGCVSLAVPRRKTCDHEEGRVVSVDHAQLATALGHAVCCCASAILAIRTRKSSIHVDEVPKSRSASVEDRGITIKRALNFARARYAGAQVIS